MSSSADAVMLTFPPRPVSQWERAVLAEWFAATQLHSQGVAAAYVSESRGDDPMMYGRIVVTVRPSNEPAHLVYSPAGSAIWVVASAPDWRSVRRFRTLRSALNGIRQVLAEEQGQESPGR